MSRGEYIERLSGVDRAYAERNAVVLAFAQAAAEAGPGWAMGVLSDPEEPEWPVVVIETPAGQMSWHVPRDELPEHWREGRHSRDWDGHTTREKYDRLERLLG